MKKENCGEARTAAPPGRPRAFDADAALECALRLFRRKGYEGTSIADLTAAMGINRPSLYAAFGNKEALFRKALDRYAAGPGAYACAALAEPTARAVAERMLFGAAAMQSDPDAPAGCLNVRGVLSGGDEAEAIRCEVAARHEASQAALRARFERARAEGDLPADADPADLARFVAAVMQGMAVQATGGATAAELRAVAETALRVFPG